MRPDGAFMPPHPVAAMTRDDALAHPTFVSTVLALWDKGLDTAQIAGALFQREAVVAYCLKLGRDARHNDGAFA